MRHFSSFIFSNNDDIFPSTTKPVLRWIELNEKMSAKFTTLADTERYHQRTVLKKVTSMVNSHRMFPSAGE
jgi:hypothetical protein